VLPPRRVDEGLALLRTVMGNHIKEEGRALVNDPEKVSLVSSGDSSCICCAGTCVLKLRAVDVLTAHLCVSGYMELSAATQQD
jgi:hypothetical protein